MQTLAKLAAIVVGTLSLVSCSAQDSDYFPYRMKGLNAWVYDSATEQEFFAGYVEASYSSRQEGLSGCAALASSAAAARHVQEWSHVCCTVTSDSQCATKVR